MNLRYRSRTAYLHSRSARTEADRCLPNEIAEIFTSPSRSDFFEEVRALLRSAQIKQDFPDNYREIDLLGVRCCLGQV